MGKVSAGGFNAIVGYLKFVQRGYDLTSSLALLPIACIVSACLLTLMLICMRKRRVSCGVKAKLKTTRLADISYVQVPPGGSGVVSSLTHWPLRPQPSPLLTRQYTSPVQFSSVQSVGPNIVCRLCVAFVITAQLVRQISILDAIGSYTCLVQRHIVLDGQGDLRGSNRIQTYNCLLQLNRQFYSVTWRIQKCDNSSAFHQITLVLVIIACCRWC